MNIGIYKPGQGYWVRVLTAVGAGVLVLATAAWLWQQMLLVSLPAKSWDVALIGVSGTAAPGQELELYGAPETMGQTELVVIGRATVEVFEPQRSGAPLNLGEVSLQPGRVATEIERLAAPDGSFTASVPHAGVRAVPIFEQVYLQAAAAGVAIFFGAALVYWLVGANPKMVDFLIATDGEMKKVNWSTRKDVINSTWVVIGASIVIAGGLFLVDLVFKFFFGLIGVLEG
jgi:preprotein translocase SecE subunit